MGAKLCGRGAIAAKGDTSTGKHSKSSKRSKHGSLTGYTLEQFVNDNLVPVYGFACWVPREPHQAKDLKTKLKFSNAELMKYQQEIMNSSRPGQRAEEVHSNDVEVPLQAVCRVWLDKAEVEGDAKQSFDFNQETKLEVKVFGYMLFPPSFPWTYKDVLAAKEADETREEVFILKCKNKKCGAIQLEDDKTGEYPATCIDCGEPVPPVQKKRNLDRWHLGVEVWSVLERDMGEKANAPHDDDALFGHGFTEKPAALKRNGSFSGPIVAQPKLQVKCIHMLIEKREGTGGDPMIESWLPVQSVLSDIEVLLTAKLEHAVKSAEFES